MGNIMYYYQFPDNVPDDDSLCIVAVSKNKNTYYTWGEFDRSIGRWVIFDDDACMGDGTGAMVNVWISPKQHYTKGIYEGE